jgi:hypothetical protein
MIREKRMYKFSYNAELGIMQVDVVGAWTVEEARSYGQAAGQQFSHARGNAGRLRLLINLLQCELMTQEVIVPLMSSGTQNGRPDDIIAIAVASPAMHLQLRRMFSERDASFFDSVEQAVDWLRGQGRQ